MIKKAALVKEGRVENVIVVDISSDFNFASLGYVVVGDDVSIGWLQKEDGNFEPSLPIPKKEESTPILG